MALEVYLVRHGKTVFNTTGRVQGWSDSPLTTEGREIAERLGRNLHAIHFDAAFASTLPRAYETAGIIVQHKGQPDLVVQHIADLREYCFGGLEGEFSRVVYQMIAERRGFPDLAAWKQAYRHAKRHLLAEAIVEFDSMGLAETEAQFVQRLQNGMAEVVRRSEGLQRVLVVAHGMAITAFLKSIDFDIMGYHSLPNASVSRLRFVDGQWHIDSVGETTWIAQQGWTRWVVQKIFGGVRFKGTAR